MHTHVSMEEEKSKVFAADDRILLGEGLFETLKVVHGKPCCPDLHWQRLNSSAQQLGIPFTLPYGHWLQCLVQKIQQDKLTNGGIKAILSGGSAPRGLTQYGQQSQLVLQCFQFTAQTQPLRLILAPWLRDAANPIYKVKSVNYLEAILARRQALAAGADDALFFNSEHHATETTCANLFIIQQQTLFTPPLTDGVLPGITRSRILAFCRQQNISCHEQSLTQARIEAADAVFITNSLQGLQVIRSLAGVDFVLNHPLIEQLMSFLIG
ncbi:MAG: aminotransferase class IV [Legionella sp.]|uniref:aminotransferase class IV n=1 Tax=Legionella sp. TaxID=459 RepID=UPI002842A637|nr:aminotransferase class IV [Legionella sp.]